MLPAGGHRFQAIFFAARRLFIMRPHTKHFNDPLVFQYLIDKAVLDVDPA